MQEANGLIRGLDPDGRIQANAKHKSASREATPEEYHLAEVLKEVSGNSSVTRSDHGTNVDDTVDWQCEPDY